MYDCSICCFFPTVCDSFIRFLLYADQFSGDKILLFRHHMESKTLKHQLAKEPSYFLEHILHRIQQQQQRSGFFNQGGAEMTDGNSSRMIFVERDPALWMERSSEKENRHELQFFALLPFQFFIWNNDAKSIFIYLPGQTALDRNILGETHRRQNFDP